MHEHLSEIYSERFSNTEEKRKEQIWQILVSHFFQRYVPTDGSVLDLGTGNGEFINSVQAERKFAVDLNPDSRNKLIPAVEFIETNSTNLSMIANQSIDTVFTSNFFEHLPNAESLIDTLKECRACLKPTGTLLVLIPNIKYVKEDFWDYLDHTLPLTHRSMVEALQLAKFDVTEVYPRFLPYTIKNRRIHLPLWSLKIYLKAQWLWPIFGKQMLVIARPSELTNGLPSNKI